MKELEEMGEAGAWAVLNDKVILVFILRVMGN